MWLENGRHRDGCSRCSPGGPRHIDETYSTGYTNLTYFDVEQRRLGAAAELLDVSIPLMVEHDLPICRVVQTGSRSRLNLLFGDWDDALSDADAVLGSPSAPFARTWPLLIRGLVSLRRSGHDGGRSTMPGSSQAGTGSCFGCCRPRRPS